VSDQSPDSNQDSYRILFGIEHEIVQVSLVARAPQLVKDDVGESDDSYCSNVVPLGEKCWVMKKLTLANLAGNQSATC